jgi:hypothetical protein
MLPWGKNGKKPTWRLFYKIPDCQSQQWELACVTQHLALWESFKELGQKSQTIPWLCHLVSGLVRKPDIQKNSIQCSQMASCPSDVNKKIMLTVCFYCFSVPIFLIYLFIFTFIFLYPSLPPPPLHLHTTPFTPLTPRYQAETILPLFLILLKREFKQ